MKTLRYQAALLGFIIFLFALPSAGAAQFLTPETILPTTVDARSAAMGRTALLSANGSNALFSNPGGLALLSGIQVQGGGRLRGGTAKQEGNEQIEGTGYSPHIKADHLSLALPYQAEGSPLKFGAGIGYQTYYDLGRRWYLNTGNAEATTNVSGGLNTISPAAAVSFQDLLFVGVAFNQSVREDISFVNTRTYDDFDKEENEIELNGSGSFLHLGGGAKVTPELTVGFSYRPGFELEVEAITINGEDCEENCKTEYDFPALLGASASYQVMSELLIVGEYQSRPFSGYEVNSQDWFDLNDGSNLRLGAELGGDHPIRFGVFRDALPVPDREDEDDDAINHLLGVTGGGGLSLGPIALDMAVEGATWREENAEGDSYSEKLFRLRLAVRYILQ